MIRNILTSYNEASLLYFNDDGFVNDCTEASTGKRTYISSKLECENILYLSDYYEFLEEIN